MAGISSDIIRGYNDTMILCLLLEGPSYGYEISKRIRVMTGEKYVIKETTLYSAFTRMEKNGFITSFSMNAENGKRRTYYRITDAGRAYYREKCVEWELTKDVVERFIAGPGRGGRPSEDGGGGKPFGYGRQPSEDGGSVRPSGFGMQMAEDGGSSEQPGTGFTLV